MKHCTKCHVEKDESEFTKRTASRLDGLTAKCTECISAEKKEAHVENRETDNAYGRQWRVNNPERVKANNKKRYNDHKKEDTARRQKWSDDHPEETMLYRIKVRVNKALKEGIVIPFDLTIEDIVIPTHCPIPHCGVKLGKVKGTRMTTPSPDKVIPANGYTKGNVIVICTLCNMRKSDLSIEKFYSFGGFYEDLRDEGMTFSQRLDRLLA